MKRILFVVTILIGAVIGFSQDNAAGPPKSDPKLDPAASFILQIPQGAIWFPILVPTGTRAINLKIGHTFEGFDVIDLNPPVDYNGMANVRQSLPVGRLYATITSVSCDWKIHIRHYVLDVR